MGNLTGEVMAYVASRVEDLELKARAEAIAKATYEKEQKSQIRLIFRDDSNGLDRFQERCRGIELRLNELLARRNA